jgi:hypothetical protein
VGAADTDRSRCPTSRERAAGRHATLPNRPRRLWAGAGPLRRANARWVLDSSALVGTERVPAGLEMPGRAVPTYPLLGPAKPQRHSMIVEPGEPHRATDWRLAHGPAAPGLRVPAQRSHRDRPASPLFRRMGRVYYVPRAYA